MGIETHAVVCMTKHAHVYVFGCVCLCAYATDTVAFTTEL